MKAFALAAAFSAAFGSTPGSAWAALGERMVSIEARGVRLLPRDVSLGAAADFIAAATLGEVLPAAASKPPLDSGETAPGRAPAETVASAQSSADAPVAVPLSADSHPSGAEVVFRVTFRAESAGLGRPASVVAGDPLTDAAAPVERPPVRGRLAESAANLGSGTSDPSQTLSGLFEAAEGRPARGPARLVVGGGRVERFPRLRPNDVSLNIDPKARPHVMGTIERAPFADGVFGEVLFEGLAHADITARGLREAARVLSSGGRLVVETGPGVVFQLGNALSVLRRAAFSPAEIALRCTFTPSLWLTAVRGPGAQIPGDAVGFGPALPPDEVERASARLEEARSSILALSPGLGDLSLFVAAMLTSGLGDWRLAVPAALRRSTRAALESPTVRAAVERLGTWAPPRLSVVRLPKGRRWRPPMIPPAG